MKIVNMATGKYNAEFSRDLITHVCVKCKQKN